MSSPPNELCSECRRWNYLFGTSLAPECTLDNSLFSPDMSSQELSINMSSLTSSRLELCAYLQTKVSLMSQPHSQSSLRRELKELLSQSPSAYGPQYWQHLSVMLQKLKKSLSVEQKKNT